MRNITLEANTVTLWKPWSIMTGRPMLLIKNGDKRNGITLGSYININDTHELPYDVHGNFAPYMDDLYMHEYGHYLQSQSMGPFYVPIVAVPSFTSAVIVKDGNHRYSSYERDANYRAFMYFNKYVEGFYESTMNQNKYNGDKSKGWHFVDNPLLPYEYSKEYIDFQRPEIMERIERYLGYFYNFWHF